MLRRNIDVSIGLVNGTIGIVVSVSKDKENIIGVRIKLKTGEEYTIPRLEYKFLVMDKIYIVREQFPLCTSYGITIHKSQGLSLENAVIDVGNCIFANGQTYVALSRVTKAEGLHLINFDPLRIMADESAILEYNRLREMYRPDLKKFNLSSSNKLSYCKIPDAQWANAMNMFIQNDNCNFNYIINACWNITGLPNTHNLCYTNVSVQSLFHSRSFRRVIMQQKECDILKNLFNQYTSKTIVEIKRFREFVNEKYSTNEQEDVSEFIMDLCNKFSILNIFSHELTTVVRCPACSERNSNTTTNYILSLCIPEERKKTYTLQDIINYNIGNWQEIEGNCKHKCKCKMLQEINLSIKGTILIVQLVLFTVNNRKTSKITNLKIKDVPKSKITINKHHYKVISGIFHHGATIKGGHYTNMLRQNDQWVQVNDSIFQKKSWPKCAKDVYVLFLEDIALHTDKKK